MLSIAVSSAKGKLFVLITGISQQNRNRSLGFADKCKRSLMVLRGDLIPKWPVGRPRKRWLNNISESIVARGKTLRWVEKEQLFKERSRWRLCT